MNVYHYQPINEYYHGGVVYVCITNDIESIGVV